MEYGPRRWPHRHAGGVVEDERAEKEPRAADDDEQLSVDSTLGPGSAGLTLTGRW